MRAFPSGSCIVRPNRTLPQRRQPLARTGRCGATRLALIDGIRKECALGGSAFSFVAWCAWVIVMIVLVVVLLRARRGDGRTDVRRCPRCWYDLGNLQGLRCPECGHTAREERMLFLPKPHRRTHRFAAIALLALAPIGIWSLLPAHWTRKTPPIVLRGLLALQGTPPLGPAGIPQPRGGTSYPNHGWHNLAGGTR